MITNVMLTIETIRRYTGASPLFLFIFDILVVLNFFRISIRLTYVLVLLALSIFGLFSAIDTHWNPIVTYLGVRLPAIFIMLTLIAKYTQKRANIIVSQNYLLNRNILLAVHLLAILQIYFGPSHFISQLPKNIDSFADGQGHIDNMYLSIIDFFRSTSIFLHTGKYGQFSALFSVVLLIQLSRNNFIFQSLAIVVLNLVPLQKSGIIVVCLSFIILNFKKIFSNTGNIVVITILAIGLSPVLYAVIENILEQIPIRIQWNILNPVNLYERAVGIGTYAPGATLIAEMGTMSDFTLPGEGSHIRAFYEGGLSGFFVNILIFFIFPIFLVSKKRVLRNEKYNALLCITLVNVWSLTHDIFGNYLTVLLYASIISLTVLRSNAE